MIAPDPTERNRIVARSIAHTLAEVQRADPATVVTRLDDCRAILLADPLPDHERLDIERRIAETKLSVLFEHPDDGRFLQAWREMASLGYSSPERELSMLFYFLKFCRLQGREDADSQSAMTRYEALAMTADEPIGAHFRRALDLLRRA